jgi:hypothetical protein
VIPIKRVVRAEASESSGVVYAKLPAPPRGTLHMVRISQVGGTATAAEFSIYDRRGACAELPDLHVAGSGTVSFSADEGTLVLELNQAGVHQGKQVYQEGDKIQVKNSAVDAYNTIHTITGVHPTEADQYYSDIAYVSDEAEGTTVWQAEPYMQLFSPTSHLVYEGTITEGVPFDSNAEVTLEQTYENRDNQLETNRMRESALWLELTPAGGTDTAWEVAYVCSAPSMF